MHIFRKPFLRYWHHRLTCIARIVQKLVKSILSKSELSKIASLGAYVSDNFDTRMTILKLSRLFVISPKKIQVVVNQIYVDSVGHYISKLRMGHAKHLFGTTGLNVSENYSRIGIYSPSYFSKLFKNRYGMSPSTFRK